MTNREWLESLSYETFLRECSNMSWCKCAHCIYEKVDCLKIPETCEQAQVKWLKQEHKEAINDK